MRLLQFNYLHDADFSHLYQWSHSFSLYPLFAIIIEVWYMTDWVLLLTPTSFRRNGPESARLLLSCSILPPLPNSERQNHPLRLKTMVSEMLTLISITLHSAASCYSESWRSWPDGTIRTASSAKSRAVILRPPNWTLSAPRSHEFLNGEQNKWIRAALLVCRYPSHWPSRACSSHGI